MEVSLKKKTIHGIGWRGSVDLIEQILQIGFTAILARLLTSADFGLIAMAMLINRFFTTVTNVGFGGAIIRSQTVTNEQVSAIFLIQLAINLSLSLVIFFTADLTAAFFNETQLVNIIKVSCWVVLLQSLEFPALLLQKEMNFKKLSLMQISTMLLANISAIILAFKGFGYWALVFRLFIQGAGFGVLSWVASKWRPIKPSFKGLKPFMIFGFNMLGANMVSFFAENMIAIITGRYLGKEVMGYLNVAYNLAIVPASKIKNVLAAVLTPSFSKIQHNSKSFYDNNRNAVILVTLFFVPLMFVLSAVSEDLIAVIYGVKWLEAAPMLALLSFVGLLKGVAHLLRSTILVKGHANVVLLATAIEAAISIPIMYILIDDYQIYGLIIAYLMGAFISTLYIVFFYNSLFNDRWFFYRNSYSAFIIGGIIFIFLYFTNYHYEQSIISLLLKLLLAIAAFVLGLLILYKPLVDDVVTMFKKRV